MTSEDDRDRYRQQFVKAVEDLVRARKVERKSGSFNGHIGADKATYNKKFNYSEVAKVIPSWKDYASGRIKQPPSRWQIMNLTDEFDCTTRERNLLLVAAGYKPEEEFVSGGLRLKQLLEPCYRIMRFTPFPSYIVNRDWSILAASTAALTFFGLSPVEVDNIPAEQLNVISLLLHEDSPVRKLIIAEGKDYWWQVVYRNIMGFLAENELCLYDDWFVSRVEKFREFPEFREIYDKGYRPFINMNEWSDYVTKFKRDSKTLTVRSVIANAGDALHPQVVYYIPADESTEKWFADNLGIHTPPKTRIHDLYEH